MFEDGARMRKERAVVWKAIGADEVRWISFGFHRAHPECGTVVHIERGELSLVCWCERCQDLQAYEIDAGRGSLPAV